MQVKFKKLHQDAVLPQYATSGSSGFDLVALEDVEFDFGQTKLVRTGLSVEIPVGYEIQIRPRSGTSLKTPLRIANSPGTIDFDFRGEIGIIVSNTRHPDGNSTPMLIKKGTRIAQGVIVPIIRGELIEVNELSETERGEGGFGSTDVK